MVPGGGREGAREIIQGAPELKRLDAETERACGVARGLELVRRRGVPEDSHASHLRQGLSEQFYSLPRQLDLLQEHAGDVAPGPGEAGNIPKRDRIVVDCHDDDRPGARHLPRGTCRGLRSSRDEQVDVEANQLGSHAGQEIEISYGGSEFDGDAPAVDVPELAEPLLERSNAGG